MQVVMGSVCTGRIVGSGGASDDVYMQVVMGSVCTGRIVGSGGASDDVYMQVVMGSVCTGRIVGSGGTNLHCAMSSRRCVHGAQSYSDVMEARNIIVFL